MMNQPKLTAVGVVPNTQVPGTPEPDPGQRDYGEQRVEDPNAKLKQEILDAQEQRFSHMQNALISHMQSTIQGTLAAKEAKVEDELPQPTKDHNPLLSEFREEMDKLGLDEDTTAHLMSFISKVNSKQVGKFKQNLKNEISEEQRAKEKKQQADSLVTEQYPDILNQSSGLFKEAQRVYGEMQKDNDPMLNSPYATAHAVREAASRMGIPAVSRAAILQRDAYNPSGGIGGEKRSEEVTQKALDFGAAFGIHPDKMKEKLHLIRGRK